MILKNESTLICEVGSFIGRVDMHTHTFNFQMQKETSKIEEQECQSLNKLILISKTKKKLQ